MQEITDRKTWDQRYEANRIPSGHFLQSWQWGELKRSLGLPVRRFTDGRSIAQVIELPLPFGKKYWYCPKGPVYANQESGIRNQEFLNDLVMRAREARAIFLRLEPAFMIHYSSFMIQQTKSMQPRCTSLVSLSASEDEILAAMHEKTRYNIRLAERHGVAVERHGHAEEIFEELYALFAATAVRDRFRLHTREHYKRLLSVFREPGQPYVSTFVARHEGKLLAAAIVMFDSDTATYLHGASSDEHRNVMAPHALHWAVMRHAREYGCARYDLWGIDTGDEPTWKGITRFKLGFGGETLCAPGTFDLSIDRFWYSLYTLTRKFT